jgi:2-oxo-3-hexenedioate decarboxylase
MARSAGQTGTAFVIDPEALADELSAAYAARRTDVVPPTSREAGFDLQQAYAVEAELTRRRIAAGRAVVGRKVGFANKAVWRALKLDTLVWASMYDDTVRDAGGNQQTLSIERMAAPKIEPEIVFRLRPTGVPPGSESDAATMLASVEWLALGFEIIDCVYAGWKFQPPDFVAAYGLHAALVVGEPLPVAEANIAALVEQLPAFKVTLARGGEIAAEGSGRNSLRSPALCLAELAAAAARQSDAAPLQGGELVSSGTLTESQSIKSGETWTATVDGLPLPALTLRIE